MIDQKWPRRCETNATIPTGADRSGAPDRFHAATLKAALPMSLAVTLLVAGQTSVAAPSVEQSDQLQDKKQNPPTTTRAAGKGAQDQSADASDEREDIGMTLKGAVQIGAMSEAQAIKVYMSLTEVPGGESKGSDTRDGADVEPGPWAAKGDIAALASPQPGQIEALFKPQFLRRDVQLLRDVLELDRDQLTIVEVLVEDYLESFDLVARPLREALQQYWQVTTQQWAAAALERAHQQYARDYAERKRREADMIEVNKEALQARAEFTKHALVIARDRAKALMESQDGGDEQARADSDRELLKQRHELRERERDLLTLELQQQRKLRDWEQRMARVTAELEDRLAALNGRIEQRMAELSSTGESITADDLVDLAREVRDERDRLRAEFIESLGLITMSEPSETQQARFDQAIARMRIERDLLDGRFGGETMNLWAALTDATRSIPTQRSRDTELPHAWALLDAYAIPLAQALRKRTNTAVEREIEGLEVQARRDDAMRSADAWEDAELSVSLAMVKPLAAYARASHREVDASVEVRDTLLRMLTDSRVLIETDQPGGALGQAYHDQAMRRGFRSQMRSRWCERALDAALRFDELEPEARAAIIEARRVLPAELRPLREATIRHRIDRDPKLADEHIKAQFEGGDSPWDDMDIEEMLGLGYKAFKAIDDRTESLLKAFLTPDQFTKLPRRVRIELDRFKAEEAKQRDAAQRKAKAAAIKKAKSGKGTSGKGR